MKHESRDRTAWQVKNGQCRQVSVRYDKRGQSTVTPVGDWQPITDALRAKWQWAALPRCIELKPIVV